MFSIKTNISDANKDEGVFEEKYDTDEDIDFNGPLNNKENPKNTRETMRQGGTLIFTRKREIVEKEVLLQDFIIKKIIGKGAFGKVFLVQHNTTG
jgi:hypothetical protein